MLQIFFKSAKINNAEWSKIYPQIKNLWKQEKKTCLGH